MSQIDRRAAIATYKKRESMAGIYAFRAASGQTWVGYARDVDAIGNRIRFGLRTGGARNPALQAAWDAEGPEAFSLEFLELLDADALGLDPEKALRLRAAHWREALGASAI